MDQKEKIFKHSIEGILYIYVPWIFELLGYKFIALSSADSLEMQIRAFITNILDIVFVISIFIGVMTILGVFCELIIYLYRKELISLDALHHAHDIEGNSIIFWIHNGKLYERKVVSHKKLSNTTRTVIVKKIEEPLWDIYKIALSGKRARSAYNACSVYINSIADDLDKAIQQCSNEQMEEKLISKLYILEDMLEYIKSEVTNAAQTEEEERQFYNVLNVQEFNPFTVTENLNKLV